MAARGTPRSDTAVLASGSPPGARGRGNARLRPAWSALGHRAREGRAWGPAGRGRLLLPHGWTAPVLGEAAAEGPRSPGQHPTRGPASGLCPAVS